MNKEAIQTLIRDIADFPKKGVMFKDITPVLQNAEAYRFLIQHLAELVDPKTHKIVAIESRGFILGAAVAQHIGCGLVLVRKPGKLPYETWSESYSLEYGHDTLEIHKDAILPGENVTIMDDVLATGGTASAVEKLCLKLSANVL